MLSRSQKNILKATALTLAMTVLVALGTDFAKADGRGYTPVQAIDETVGSKHFLAVYHKAQDSCYVQVMVGESQSADGASSAIPAAAARMAFSLKPHETAYLGAEEYESLAFGCGENADSLTVSRGDRVYALNAQ
jgi:hypothetical protein